MSGAGSGRRIKVPTSAPVLLCKRLPGGKADQVLFLNNGTVPVYLGDGTVSPAWGFPVEPLGTLAVPGDADWYGIADPTAPVPQVINVIPGGLAATPSAAQIAIQIAAQNLGVLVTNSQIPSRPVIKFAAINNVNASGLYTIMVPAPGPGQSIFVYMVSGTNYSVGPSSAGLSYTLLQLGPAAGSAILFATLGTGRTTIADLDGFQCGDNIRLDANVSFPAGNTVPTSTLIVTYAVGPTQ